MKSHAKHYVRGREGCHPAAPSARAGAGFRSLRPVPHPALEVLHNSQKQFFENGAGSV